MIAALLLTTAAIGAPTVEQIDSLTVRIEGTPTEAQLGDVVFLRIIVRNDGKEAISVPTVFSPDFGNLLWELVDTPEQIWFWFAEGDGSGWAAELPLQPGEQRVVSYEVLPLPRLDDLKTSFWDPQQWERGRYPLLAYLRMGKKLYLRTYGPEIEIRQRKEKGMAAVLDWWETGVRAYRRKRLPEWDPSRPTTGIFNLPRYGVDFSAPEQLTALEAALSPGSLRDLVHVTRLTQAVYDAKHLAEKRKATAKLLQWLDDQPQIARHWIAMQLLSWGMRNEGLKEYRFEFVDQVIPHLPENYGAQNWQEQYRKENERLRQWYLKHVRQERQSAQAAAESPSRAD